MEELNDNEEYTLHCCGGGYGTYRLLGGIVATLSFAAIVDFDLTGLIPYIIIHAIFIPLGWLYSLTRSETHWRGKSSRAFCCSFMWVWAIWVSLTAGRAFSLFFMPVIMTGDYFVPEMFDEEFGNRLLDRWNVTHMAQVDGLACAAHLREQRLHSAFFNCGNSAETCGCQFWNRTSNQPVVFELYGHLRHLKKKEKKSWVAYLLFPDALILHVIPAIIALMIGPFQLNPKFRNTSKKRHKICGYVYSLCVLISAVGSFYLEAVTVAHFVAILGLMCVSLGWVFTLCMGVLAIHSFPWDKKKRILSHKRWMIRNYFLTYTGVIFRW